MPEDCRKHRPTSGALRAWLQEVKSAEWATPADLRAWFPSASIFEEENLVSFRIKDSRLLARVDYSHSVVRIERIVEAEANPPRDEASSRTNIYD